MKFINVLKQYNKALIRENAKLQRTYNELISESADGEDLQNETTEEFTDPTPNPLDETEEKTDDRNKPTSSDDIRSKIIKAAKVDRKMLKTPIEFKDEFGSFTFDVKLDFSKEEEYKQFVESVFKQELIK